MNFDFIQDLHDDEVVKPMKGFPRGYFITNQGRIYGQGPGLGKKGRWLKSKDQRPINGKNRGTPVIKCKSYLLHRLVAENFLPDYDPKLIVCHIDETLEYPLVHGSENLFMGTHTDNMKDMVSKGRNVGFTKHRHWTHNWSYEI